MKTKIFVTTPYQFIIYGLIVDLDCYLYCIIDLYCVDINGNGNVRMLGFKPDQRF